MTTAIFTPKAFADIAAGMIEHLRLSTDQITDFNVGSVARSLLEATAVELDDYYQEVYAGLLRAIPTAIYVGFGFNQRPAVAAAGLARFTRVDTPGNDQEIVIPAGTRLVAQHGAYYVTDALVVLTPQTTTASVTISAEVVGAAGNADPGQIQFVAFSYAHLVAVTNPAAISGGEDAESEDQRALRFALFIQSLARGTPAALEYAATLPALYHPVTGVLYERVQRAAVQETPGHVDLFVYNGSYGASAALVAAVQAEVDGYWDPAASQWRGGFRPAGMRVDVQAMSASPVSVALEITRTVGAEATTVEQAVRGALERRLRGALPGEVVRPIDVINTVLAVTGVEQVVILAPTAPLTVPAQAVLYLQALTVTWTA